MFSQTLKALIVAALVGGPAYAQLPTQPPSGSPEGPQPGLAPSQSELPRPGQPSFGATERRIPKTISAGATAGKPVLQPPMTTDIIKMDPPETKAPSEAKQ